MNLLQYYEVCMNDIFAFVAHLVNLLMTDCGDMECVCCCGHKLSISLSSDERVDIYHVNFNQLVCNCNQSNSNIRIVLHEL